LPRAELSELKTTGGKKAYTMFDVCKARGSLRSLDSNKSKIALAFLCFNCGLRLIWPEGECSHTTAMTGAKTKANKYAGEDQRHFYLQVGDGSFEIICYLHICQK